MRGGNDVRPCGVNARMNGEGGEIDFSAAFDDLAGMIYQNQVRGANPAEVQPERVHPEMIEAFGIACGDVASDAFVEAKFSEEAERSGEALFAVAAFFGRSSENGRARDAVHKASVGLSSGRWLRHPGLPVECQEILAFSEAGRNDFQRSGRP